MKIDNKQKDLNVCVCVCCLNGWLLWDYWISPADSWNSQRRRGEFGFKQWEQRVRWQRGENRRDQAKSDERRDEGKNCKNDGEMKRKWQREESWGGWIHSLSVCEGVWSLGDSARSLAHPEVLGVNRVSREDSWTLRLRPVSPTATAVLCWPIWPSSSSSSSPPPQTFTWGWRSGHTEGDGGGVRRWSNSVLCCIFRGWYWYLLF